MLSTPRLVARTLTSLSRSYLNPLSIASRNFRAATITSWPADISTGETTTVTSQAASAAYCAPFPRRTHTCGSLIPEDVDHKVVLTGWLVPKRKVNKNFSFLGIRDSFGTTQLVVDARVCGPELLAAMREVPEESTVLIEGIVRMRPESQQREYAAGKVEVVVNTFTLLNPADRNMPFMPFDTQNLANEDLRLRYRYLDLRRDELTRNLRKRSDIAHLIRSSLHDRDFVEVETPMLLNSTPEGAREFLVPTRTRTSSIYADTSDAIKATSIPGASVAQPLFYALSQSPQQPKQLLVASGAVDRYYQLARCFRDEDGRKDRQPEFTQVDLEMAWVSWGEPVHENKGDSGEASSTVVDQWRIGGHEVRDVVEMLIRRIWEKAEGIQLDRKFRVMTYQKAMAKYGSDKPDLRFGFEIENITSNLPNPLRAVLEEREETVEALIVPRCKSSPSPFLRAAKEVRHDGIIDRIEVAGGSDSAWLSKSRIVQQLLGASEQNLGNLDVNNALGLTEGGTIWLAKRRQKAENVWPQGGWTPLGRLRLALADTAQRLGDLTLASDPKFLWVTEFPLFTHADDDKDFLAHGRWSSSHHPFTAPMWEDIEKMYAGKIAEVRGQHYDLVLNGVEIGGGSVRVHDAAMQDYMFTHILQLTEKEKFSFNHLLHALRCGAPPHGGFAFGFDRLIAILCKTESIRDVIAFPKTAAGTDLLFKSPSPSTPEVLAQYSIRPH
ncbi:Aspartate--tRNA ligase [Grifola frondosa]|uniref:Aspartate--tRNA ligase n=1 Tax=Grifola frondosa TaxID=5627 RepID=A0A1C7MI53_GRIFR|nr:Aspartate--tRNA ligase [Grifola frondosa]